MTNQDQLNLAMQAFCIIQQNQLLKQQDAMLRELMDRVESVGHLLWRMDRRLTAQPVDQAGTRKRAAKKRRPAHKQSVARTRSDK